MEYFVISLKKTPHRLKSFYLNNRHLDNINAFEAIDSANLNRDSLVNDGFITSDNRFMLGSLGNTMSHIELWKYSIVKNTSVTIFEDDAFIHKNFTSASNTLLEDINHEYDFFGWGWNFDADLWVASSPFISPYLIKSNQNSLRTHKYSYLSSEIKPIKTKLYFSCGGTIGYSITPAGAKKFLEQCTPIQSDHNLQIPCGEKITLPLYGLDMALSKVFSISRSYVSFPPLVLTDNNIDESTINRENEGVIG
jgi:glycosyl transferase family 25